MRLVTLGALVVATALVGAAAAVPASARAPEPWLDAPSRLDIAALFDAPESEWGPGHRGLDLWLPEGSPVRSPADGIVTFAGPVAGREIVVMLHASGLRSTLEPLRPEVAVGDSIAKGETVGTLELAGSHCAARACLHWGVRSGDEYVDPLDVLAGYGPIRLLPLRGGDD